MSWKGGAVLVSMLWTAIIVQVLDRQWKLATIWAIIAALFALFGIIHVPAAGFSNLSAPFWEQCVAGSDGLASCWQFAEQCMFFVAYLILAGTFAITGVASRFDDRIKEPIDDETRHAFDDWFKDAKLDTSKPKFLAHADSSRNLGDVDADADAPAKKFDSDESDNQDHVQEA